MTIETPEAAAVLQQYRAGLRRGQIIYASIISAVVLALLVTVLVAWDHGEITHTKLHTVSQAPPTVALQALSAAPATTWDTTDRSAIGYPYWMGTAVTWSAHTVHGRNLATGAVTWSYTRTDRTVCQVVETSGVSIAIYRLHGDCDEVTALDSQTGARRWSRTLDEDTHLITGQPQYSVGQFTVLITTPNVVFAIDPSGGLDRWRFNQTGCVIHSAVIGSQGALISQTCSNPDCSGLKFCGPGNQLLLRDPNSGHQDDSTKAAGNPDQIKWNLIGNSDVPVSADQVITAADPSGSSLTVFTATNGKTLATRSLSGGQPTASAVSAFPTLAAEVLWLGGVTYALPLTGDEFLWKASTTGPVSVTAPSGATDSSVPLIGSIVLAGSSSGVVSINPATGATTTTYSVPTPAAGSVIYPVGTGFLVTGASTALFS